MTTCDHLVEITASMLIMIPSYKVKVTVSMEEETLSAFNDYSAKEQPKEFKAVHAFCDVYHISHTHAYTWMGMFVLLSRFSSCMHEKSPHYNILP